MHAAFRVTTVSAGRQRGTTRRRGAGCRAAAARTALILVAGLAAVGCRSGQDAVPETPGDDEAAVRAAVAAFYTDYVATTRLNAETGLPENPLMQAEAYRDDPRLDARMVEQVDALVEGAGEAGLSADPFLCAASVPENVSVDTVTLAGGEAQAIVYTRMPGIRIPFRVTVDLARGEDGVWRLSGVTCR